MDGGLGTALKPAYEPIVLARKPLARRAGRAVSTTTNLELHGVGAMNIEAARRPRPEGDSQTIGYWPANVALGHSDACTSTCSPDCAVRLIDSLHASMLPLSRIFYASKASRSEREAGLYELPRIHRPVFSDRGNSRARSNIHPTVKPLGLMGWLVRLVALPGAVVLDPFAGSGSTGCAVLASGERRQFVGIESQAEYTAIARARLRHFADECAPEGKARRSAG